MNRHTLSFSVADSTGNLLKTNTFKEFNLLLSRRCFPWVPSVLLIVNSSLEKKYGRSPTAHRCLSRPFSSSVRTISTFLGVTQVRITSSPTFSAMVLLERGTAGVSGKLPGSTIEGVCGVAVFVSSSPVKSANVSTSIVDRSSWSGTQAGNSIKGRLICGSLSFKNKNREKIISKVSISL